MSGAVAAVDNGSGLVCKPYNLYIFLVLTNELKRRAANYSETGAGGWGGGFESVNRSFRVWAQFVCNTVRTMR